MELNPWTVYNKAVSGLPSLRYGLGVAGVVAAATIAFNLASNDPRKAVLAFVFVLAGMYLLLIFANIGKKLLGDIIRGPAAVLIWTVTLVFNACLILTLTAFAIGWPAGWAELVGATPKQLRVASATSSGPEAASAPALAASRPARPAIETVAETFKISDSSNDCGINRTKTLEYCLASPAKLRSWSGPEIQSANCGSTISNVRAVAGKENCVAVDVTLRGCGYDNFVFAKNCRGRGWLGASLRLEGERPAGTESRQ